MKSIKGKQKKKGPVSPEVAKRNRSEYQRRYYLAHRAEAIEYQRRYNLLHKRGKKRLPEAKRKDKNVPESKRDRVKFTFNAHDIMDSPVEKTLKMLQQIIAGERMFTIRT